MRVLLVRKNGLLLRVKVDVLRLVEMKVGGVQTLRIVLLLLMGEAVIARIGRKMRMWMTMQLMSDEEVGLLSQARGDGLRTSRSSVGSDGGVMVGMMTKMTLARLKGRSDNWSGGRLIGTSENGGRRECCRSFHRMRGGKKWVEGNLR